MTMTPEQIASAWALVNAATKGPWFAESGHEQGNGQLYWQVTDATDAIMQNQFCWCQGDHAANAAFIAASRELVPQLLAALEAERAKVQALVEAIEALNAACDAMWNDHERLEENPGRFGQPYRLKEVHMKAISEAQQKLPAALTEIKETDHE